MEIPPSLESRRPNLGPGWQQALLVLPPPQTRATVRISYARLPAEQAPWHPESGLFRDTSRPV
jgi:hypothetical protein